ncbi:hypothetical protein AC45_0070 [Escherichia coli 2-210-07_S3_C3]|nr:hypothetical protein EC3431_2357 [Escherichia coli 3431]KDX22149.1 hypothetical protein AC45_0070 [Escherichia coli 2-210-07_S3_C3]
MRLLTTCRILGCKDGLVGHKLSFLVYSMVFVDVRKGYMQKLNKFYY